MRSTLILSLGIVCTAWPVAAQNQAAAVSPDGSTAAPISVVIQPFTAAGAPPDLDRLRSILPNLVQAALFPYRGISSQVLSSSDPGGRGSAEPQFAIQGRFIQIGDKIRVDVTVRRGLQGAILVTPTATFELVEMVDAIKGLATQCARAINPSRSDPTPREPVTMAIRASFIPLKSANSPAFLQESLPKAIQRSVTQANLATVRTVPTVARAQLPDRFIVTGTLLQEKGKLYATATVRQAQDPALRVEVVTTESRAYNAPDLLARAVTEVLRAMLDPVAGGDPALNPPPSDAGACLRAAELARQKHLPNTAILCYRRAQQAAPDGDAGLRLADLYLEMGAEDAAISELEAFAGAAKHDARYHLARGLMFFAQKHTKEALDEYKDALYLGGPLRPSIYRAMGDAEMAARRFIEAAGSYQKAIETGFDQPDLYRLVARAYAAANQPDRARDVLERAVAKGGSSTELRDELARMNRNDAVRLYDEGKYSEALLRFRQAIELGSLDKSDLSDSCAHAGSILAFHTDPPKDAEAISLLNRAVEEDPRSEWPNRMLAIVYSDQKHYDRALAAAQRAVRIDASALTYKVLSDVYRDRGEPDLVIATLQKSVALGGPAAADAMVDLAVAYRDKGDFRQALQMLDEAKQRSPANENAWRVEGVTLRMMGRHADSIKAFEAALRIKPTSDGHWGLADTLMRTRDFARAETEYRATFAMDPKCGDCQVGLAKALASQGKEQEAVREIQKALDSNSPDVDYYDFRDVYIILGKPEAARKILEQVIQRKPDTLSARGALTAILHEDLFDFDAAYSGNLQIFNSKPTHESRSDFAEASFTVGRYDEAISLAGEVVAADRNETERRFAMRLIITSSYLAKKDVSQALLEVGKIVDDYKGIKEDWDRNWTFRGFKYYVSNTKDLSPAAKALLAQIATALETSRPKSDEIIDTVVKSLNDTTIETLRGR